MILIFVLWQACRLVQVIKEEYWVVAYLNLVL